MRGGISRDEALDMTPGERSMFKDYLKTRLDIEYQKPFGQQVY